MFSKAISFSIKREIFCLLLLPIMKEKKKETLTRTRKRRKRRFLENPSSDFWGFKKRKNGNSKEIRWRES